GHHINQTIVLIIRFIDVKSRKFYRCAKRGERAFAQLRRKGGGAPSGRVAAKPQPGGDREVI
ncbi:hypothetical protein, partial [Aromatoleum diolicum]|uniref:hypothetical protein n=1 Tax=Aromatoleum diolicum TaxID=75796 RepID=UPI001B7D064D